jgi:hypothetical protein
MDIVIPLGNGSKWGNKELIFALRGIEKYVPHNNIYILGHRQPFLKDVCYINCTDRQGLEWKEQNILNKILLACSYPHLSENFIFFNDDHFILQPLKSLPYYYSGTLDSYAEHRAARDTYYNTVMNTIGVLKGGGSNLFFDIHAPIVYNKKQFPRVMEMYNWNIPNGYVIKSLYCNSSGLKGTYYPDLKIKVRHSCFDLDKLVSGRRFFSVGDGAVCPALETYLSYIYPDKSKYEI